jgi:hypothetical protein
MKSIYEEDGGNAYLFLPEKWLRRFDGENIIRAISISQRIDNS